MEFVKNIFLLVVFLSLNSAKKAREYSNGRAFPPKSLHYVTDSFHEANPNLGWDKSNYLEAMAAKLSSCNFDAGIINGTENIPNKETFVAFIEYQNIQGTTASQVIKGLKTVIDFWMEKKTYTTQIEGAKKFACSVHPGCGYSEPRMGISCVFSPSSKMYEYDPADYEDATSPAPPNDFAEKSEPIPYTKDQYETGQKITESKWEHNKFLENLSLLETSCEMVNKDEWNFEKAKSVVASLGLKLYGAYGSVESDEGVDEALQRIFVQMKRDLPPNIQIGCSLIKDCNNGDSKPFIASSCVYEEKCRREVCL